MVDKALFSSDKQDWGTPKDFFDRLHKRFHFDVDLAADETNALLPTYITERMDALSEDWTQYGSTGWLNPPYGRGIDEWIDKAIREAKKGFTTVMLVPSRTDTEWFFQGQQNAVAVVFIKGRLKFRGAPSSAPFPSALLVFANNADDIKKIVSFKKQEEL